MGQMANQDFQNYKQNDPLINIDFGLEILYLSINYLISKQR